MLYENTTKLKALLKFAFTSVVFAVISRSDSETLDYTLHCYSAGGSFLDGCIHTNYTFASLKNDFVLQPDYSLFHQLELRLALSTTTNRNKIFSDSGPSSTD